MCRQTTEINRSVLGASLPLRAPLFIVSPGASALQYLISNNLLSAIAGAPLSPHLPFDPCQRSCHFFLSCPASSESCSVSACIFRTLFPAFPWHPFSSGTGKSSFYWSTREADYIMHGTSISLCEGFSTSCLTERYKKLQIYSSVITKGWWLACIVLPTVPLKI